jgi:hypothetical protein
MMQDQKPINMAKSPDCAIDAQCEDIRAALADDPGGDPEDYRADRSVTDGGE